MLMFVLMNVNFPLAFADVKVEIPPINPVKQETVHLPGASGSLDTQPKYIAETFLPNVTKTVVSVTGGLSLLFVIVSGIQILTAYNSEERIGAAKKTLTWALLGFIISILSYGIVQIIVSINLSKT